MVRVILGDYVFEDRRGYSQAPETTSQLLEREVERRSGSGGYGVSRRPSSQPSIKPEPLKEPVVEPEPTPKPEPTRLSAKEYKGLSYEQQAKIGLGAGLLTRGVGESESSYKSRLASLGKEKLISGDVRALGVTLKAVPMGSSVGPVLSPTEIIKANVGGGLYYIDPSEDVGSAKFSKPVWTLLSKTPQEAIDIESKWSGAVPVSSDIKLGAGLSEQQIKQNLKYITGMRYGAGAELLMQRDVSKTIRETKTAFKTSPESFEGQKGFQIVERGGSKYYELKPEFFQSKIETLPSSKKYLSLFDAEGKYIFDDKRWETYAKTRFEALPTGTRLRARGASQYYATLLTGGEIGHFLGEIPLKATTRTYTIKDDKIVDTGSIVPKGQLLLKLGSLPRGFKSDTFTEKMGSPYFTTPILAGTAFLVAGGGGFYKNIKTYGFKTGTAESLKGFAPFQFQTTTIPDISKELIGSGKSLTVEVVYGKGGKQFVQYTTTKTPNIKLGDLETGIGVETWQFGKQVNGKVVGTSVTSINYPETKYVGGKLFFNRVSKDYINLFQAKPTGKIGFTGETYTAEILNINKYQFGEVSMGEFSGIRQDIAKTPKTKMFIYAGGKKVEGIINVPKSSVTFKDPSIQKLEWFKGFKPEVKGVGYSIDIGRYPSTDGTTIIGGGGTKTKLDFSFKTPTVSGVSGSGTITQPKVFQGGFKITKQSMRTPTVQESLTKTIPIVSTTLKKEQLTDESIKTKSIFGGGLIYKTNLKSLTKQYPISTTLPFQTTRQSQQMKQASKTKLVSKQITTPTAFAPTIKPNVNFPIPAIPFWFPTLFGGAGGSSYKKIPQTRQYKYTPSFKALLLGIKGPKVSKMKGFTGFEVRPIPKDFRWQRKIKFRWY